jgi:hypothetical protein
MMAGLRLVLGLALLSLLDQRAAGSQTGRAFVGIDDSGHLTLEPPVGRDVRVGNVALLDTLNDLRAQIAAQSALITQLRAQFSALATEHEQLKRLSIKSCRLTLSSNKYVGIAQWGPVSYGPYLSNWVGAGNSSETAPMWTGDCNVDCRVGSRIKLECQ